MLGLPVRVPRVKEATALGAAILAGHGAGLYPSVEDAAQTLVQWDATYTPHPANHAVYQDMYQTWRQVYAAQLELANQGLTRHMWCAPGVQQSRI